MENSQSGISVRNAIITWSLVAVWMAFIFFMSAHTGSDLEGTGLVGMIKRWLNGISLALFGPGVDAVSPTAHFLEYAVFGCLTCVALDESGFAAKRATSGKTGMKAMLDLMVVTIVFCAVYAVTDEIHQLFVPDRACDPVDWVVDLCGTMLGTWLTCLVLSRK